MGTAVITVRPFDRADIPAVAALEAVGQSQPWTPGMLEDELGAENRSYVVAETDVVLGYGGVMVIGEEAHITNLLVDPERRGEGVGRRLMIGLIEAAISQGARHLTLEVRSKNEPARRLYQSLGLAPVGVRRGYYGDDDALIMWLQDIDLPGFIEELR